MGSRLKAVTPDQSIRLIVMTKASYFLILSLMLPNFAHSDSMEVNNNYGIAIQGGHKGPINQTFNSSQVQSPVEVSVAYEKDYIHDSEVLGIISFTNMSSVRSAKIQCPKESYRSDESFVLKPNNSRTVNVKTDSSYGEIIKSDNSLSIGFNNFECICVNCKYIK